MTAPVYPEDVAKALAYMDDAGWTRERMQGVLAIALAHLEQDPPQPEAHIYWAEEEIRWETVEPVYATGGREETPVVKFVHAGSLYVVCPHCLEPCHPAVVENGSEYRRTYFDELEEKDGLIRVSVGDSDDWMCDSEDLLCDRCSMRMGWPEVLDADYT